MAKISTLNSSVKHGNYQMKQNGRFKIIAKYLKQGIKLFQSLQLGEQFDIYFWEGFDCYRQTFYSDREVEG